MVVHKLFKIFMDSMEIKKSVPHQPFHTTIHHPLHSQVSCSTLTWRSGVTVHFHTQNMPFPYTTLWTTAVEIHSNRKQQQSSPCYKKINKNRKHILHVLVFPQACSCLHTNCNYLQTLCKRGGPKVFHPQEIQQSYKENILEEQQLDWKS